MLSYKKSLRILKKTNALLEGHFVLSSGLHSKIYIQCAKLLSFPKQASKICKSLSSQIKNKLPKIDIVLAPAMGGIIIGYEIGKLLNIETIFCERVEKKFVLRRGFHIKKNSKVLIVEDVITTGKSSLECAKLINKFGAKLAGFSCIINRSDKNKLKIRNKKIISHMKIHIPTYHPNNIPKNLKKIKITKPGSRFLK